MKYIFHTVDKSCFCEIKYKNYTFIGEAKCNPEDQQYFSEFTGSFIAEERANIKLLQHIKNNELYPKIEELNHIITILKLKEDTSTDKIIYRQYNKLNKQLDLIKNEIESRKLNLKQYIDGKDKLNKKYSKSEKK